MSSTEYFGTGCDFTEILFLRREKEHLSGQSRTDLFSTSQTLPPLPQTKTPAKTAKKKPAGTESNLLETHHLPQNTEPSSLWTTSKHQVSCCLENYLIISTGNVQIPACGLKLMSKTRKTQRCAVKLGCFHTWVQKMICCTLLFWSGSFSRRPVFSEPNFVNKWHALYRWFIYWS